MCTVASRVQAGAALLDKRKPTWVKWVDPDTLDLRSRCGCVLGQAYGEFYAGCDRLGLDPDTNAPAEFGFNILQDQTERSYPSLTRAWRKLIRERRAGE